MPNNYFNDQELIEALQRGEERALTEIFNRYWKRLYFMALRRTGSHEASEEIVQDLFTQLWDKRSKLFQGSAGETNLPAYLLTAVRNKVLNRIRSQVREDSYWEYYRNFLPDYDDSTQNSIQYNQLVDVIEKGIEKLPEKSRNVFRLNRLEGQSIAEIATKLNLSEKSIEYHLTKSLKVMRVYLKDFIVPLLLLMFAQK